MVSPHGVRVATGGPTREAEPDPSAVAAPTVSGQQSAPLDALLAGGNRAATGVLAPAEGAAVDGVGGVGAADAVAAETLAARGGTAAPDGMPDIDLDRDTDEAATVEKIATVVADIVTDFVPVVSNIKDAWTALTGVNPVTGERVGPLDRVAAGIFAIPGLGNVVKYLAKGGRLLTKAMMLLAKALDRLIERLPQILNRLRDWVVSIGDAVDDIADEIADLLSGPVFAHAGGGAGGAGGRGGGGSRTGGSGGGSGGRGGSGGGSGSRGSGGGGNGGGSPSQEPAHLADGKRQHKVHADLARNTPMADPDLVPLMIEKRVTLPSGRVIQPDAIYVNHARKPGMIIIDDLFTGPDEPLKHKAKTWLAAQIPEIADLVNNKKYELHVISTMSHASKLRH